MRKLLFLFYLLIIFCQATPALASTAGSTQTLPSPVAGSVSSPFGWRIHPITGKSRFHSGLDIAASHGTPVFAIQPGWVVFSASYAGYGNLMVVDHGNGLHTWYGHNSVLLKQPGEWVNAGDNIALVGATGHATGPHLHFEVRVRGEAVDPLMYLASLTNASPLAVAPEAPAPPMPKVTPRWIGPTTKAIGPTGGEATVWAVDMVNGNQTQQHLWVRP